MRRQLTIGLLVVMAGLSLFACNKDKRVKEKTGAPVAAIWSQLPSSSFFAMALRQPEQTAQGMRAALDKMGIFTEFYKDLDFDDMQREYGIDLFEPGALDKMGLDASKGIAMGVDGQLLERDGYYNDYAAMISTYNRPTLYWVAGLSDQAKFSAWLQAAVSKKEKTRITTEKLGDLEVSIVSEAPYSPEDKEFIKAMIVVRGGYVYAFFVTLQPGNHESVPDAVAMFKKELPGFFTRLSKPITTSANFQTIASRVNTSGDCFMFMDVASLASQYAELDKRGVIYLAPSTPEAKQYQDSERSYYESRAARDENELSSVKRLGEAYPAFGMSGVLTKEAASCEGYAMVGPSYQDDTRAVLIPSAAAPAYATLFPAGTGFVYRESLNLLALKKLVYRFFSTSEQVEMDEGWRELSDASQGMLGLELDRDILGAFTGHLAFGAPDLSIASIPFIPYSSSSKPTPKIPAAVMIAQLTSPAAGDKIINALQPMLDMVGVRTDVIEGEKMYYFNVESLEVAWARVNDLMLVALSQEALKEMVRNAKKPGMSVADKLPNGLSKSLVTDKDATGCTADMGAFFASLSAVGGSQKETATWARLASSMGSSTMKITYENNGVQCRGDLLLK